VFIAAAIALVLLFTYATATGCTKYYRITTQNGLVIEGNCEEVEKLYHYAQYDGKRIAEIMQGQYDEATYNETTHKWE